MTEQTYFTISEVCSKTGIQPYTLRYWETQFRLLRPVRRESGHRRFTAKDIETVLAIKDLIFRRGFTLAGAKKAIHGSPGSGGGQAQKRNFSPAGSELLREIQKELLAIVKEC